jgi:hypothetical protein
MRFSFDDWMIFFYVFSWVDFLIILIIVEIYSLNFRRNFLEALNRFGIFELTALGGRYHCRYYLLDCFFGVIFSFIYLLAYLYL